MTELGLGSVQFGLDYGISNDRGRITREESKRILHLARRLGITCVDTAAAYGDSEDVLGELMEDRDIWRVVTKLQPLQDSTSIVDEACRSFQQSLHRLQRMSVYGLLVHRPENLLGPRGDELWTWMTKQKDAGSVHKIGASVYYPRQADLLTQRYDIDLIQLPLSALDQRFESSGCLARLAARNVEIHVRSVFLQGLVFSDPDEINSFFIPIRPYLTAFRRLQEKKGLSPAEAALAYVFTRPEVDVVIIGIKDPAQLQISHDAIQHIGYKDIDWHSFSIKDEKWTVPTNWKLN